MNHVIQIVKKKPQKGLSYFLHSYCPIVLFHTWEFATRIWSWECKQWLPIFPSETSFTWIRYEVRLARLHITPLQILVYMRRVSLISGAGQTRMSSVRLKLGSVRIFLRENEKCTQTYHWCDEQNKHCCWELMKTRNAVRNTCKNMDLISFRSRVNTSENLHFGNGLNSYTSHINGVLALLPSLSGKVWLRFGVTSLIQVI